MTPFSQEQEDIAGKVVEFPGAAVTWAGAMPWTGGFAFGDEDGWLHVTGVDGPSSTVAPHKIIESDRSINQVAFNEHQGIRYIGASTATNVAIHRFTKDGEFVGSKPFDWGGHGIYSMRSGGFLVPMGQAGLAVLSPRANGDVQDRMLRIKPVKYFYSMCPISVLADGRELWACAGRSSGLLAIAIDQGARPEVLRSFQSVISPKDYVGVWSIATEAMPCTTVSLSRNGEVDFSQHLLEDRTPLTWHFGDARGAAYSIAAVNGHLSILTGKGLYFCMDIVKRFLDGQLRTGVETTIVRYLPLEIIDIAVAFNQWILILQPDRVVRVAVNDLLTPSISEGPRPPAERPVPRELPGSAPAWKVVDLPMEICAIA